MNSSGVAGPFGGFGHWVFAILGAGVVSMAALVNRYAPHHRKHVRRVVILYGLYLLAFVVAAGLDAVGFHEWGTRVRLAAALFEALTIVNLLSVAIFDLALPAVSVELVSITSDLLTGLAYIVTSIGVLRDAGMDLGSVVATSAVIGGVLTLSLQATLGNILGGVALQLDGSIHVGDWIQFESTRQGRVREIRWRHTVVETRDWDTVIIPNASLLSSNITILGKRDGKPIQHRMKVYFNVDFRYAPTLVIKTIDAALQEASIYGVASVPAPHCICYDFSQDLRDSFASYCVRYWLTNLDSDDGTSSLVRARIYAALQRAGIPLAIPARTLFLAEEKGEAARKARHRERGLTALRGVELLHRLTEAELELVVEQLRFSPFTAGEVVTRKGTVADCFYILTGGKVDVLASADSVGDAKGSTTRKRADNGPPIVVATLEAPGFFGEMALMTGEPRSADVVARTDIECYQLDKEGLEKILQDRPEVAKAMSETLAKRRVELEAIREGLDHQARKAREASEQQRILSKIQVFFGLES